MLFCLSCIVILFELYYSFVKMVWFFCSQAASAEGAEADDDDDGGGGGAVAEQVDPYDLLDPVDILSKLPKDFYEKVRSNAFCSSGPCCQSLQAAQRLRRKGRSNNHFDHFERFDRPYTER